MTTLFDEWSVTPEQLQKSSERSLRIGRAMWPDSEVKAKEFQASFTNMLALEDGATLPGDRMLEWLEERVGSMRF